MSEARVLLGTKLKVINIGIKTFADSLKAQGAEVVHVDWKPPAGGDPQIIKLLEKFEK